MTPRLPADALQEALEGVRPRAMTPAVREAVAVANRLGSLLPPGPDLAVSERLAAAFEKRLHRPAPPAWVRVFAPWAGAGPVPRPLVERLAAGGVVLGLLTSGGGMAVDGDPLAFAEEAAELARNLVVNLDPRDAKVGAAPTPTASAPTSTPPAPTPTPVATSTPAATPTPDDDPYKEGSDEESHGSEDRSGLSRSGGGSTAG